MRSAWRWPRAEPRLPSITITIRPLPRATLDQIKQAGGRAQIVQGDVSSVDDIQTLIDETVKAFGRLDVMVNNAGMETRTGILDTSEHQFDLVMGVDLKSAFFGCQLAAKQMIKQGGGGRIINVSSVHEDWPMPGNIAYCCAKGAIRMLARTAGVELAPHNITVVNVAPGAVNTPLDRRDTRESAGGGSPHLRDTARPGCPTGGNRPHGGVAGVPRGQLWYRRYVCYRRRPDAGQRRSYICKLSRTPQITARMYTEQCHEEAYRCAGRRVWRTGCHPAAWTVCVAMMMTSILPWSATLISWCIPHCLPTSPVEASSRVSPSRRCGYSCAKKPGFRRPLSRVSTWLPRRSGSLTPRETGMSGGVSISYDYLVIALGASTSFHHASGAATYALGLKDIADAVFLRNRVLTMLERAAVTSDPKHRQGTANLRRGRRRLLRGGRHRRAGGLGTWSAPLLPQHPPRGAQIHPGAAWNPPAAGDRSALRRVCRQEIPGPYHRRPPRNWGHRQSPKTAPP